MATPFDTIESAQQFVQLLAAEVAEVRNDVVNDIGFATQSGASRQLAALHLVNYKLEQLSSHLRGTSRLLNDLRMLRRLLVKDYSANANSLVTDCDEQVV